KRVPIPLADALKMAEKLLGEDAKNRYCVSVALYGNKEGDGKKGAWNLYYAADDGSQKQVSIHMDGEFDIKLANGPIDWNKEEGRRKELAEVKKLLQELFREM